MVCAYNGDLGSAWGLEAQTHAAPAPYSTTRDSLFARKSTLTTVPPSKGWARVSEAGPGRAQPGPTTGLCRRQQQRHPGPGPTCAAASHATAPEALRARTPVACPVPLGLLCRSSAPRPVAASPAPPLGSLSAPGALPCPTALQPMGPGLSWATAQHPQACHGTDSGSHRGQHRSTGREGR